MFLPAERIKRRHESPGTAGIRRGSRLGRGRFFWNQSRFECWRGPDCLVRGLNVALAGGDGFRTAGAAASASRLEVGVANRSSIARAGKTPSDAWPANARPAAPITLLLAIPGPDVVTAAGGRIFATAWHQWTTVRRSGAGRSAVCPAGIQACVVPINRLREARRLEKGRTDKTHHKQACRCQENRSHHSAPYFRVTLGICGKY